MVSGQGAAVMTRESVRRRDSDCDMLSSDRTWLVVLPILRRKAESALLVLNLAGDLAQ
jgi:hypothetical protein